MSGCPETTPPFFQVFPSSCVPGPIRRGSFGLSFTRIPLVYFLLLSARRLPIRVRNIFTQAAIVPLVVYVEGVSFFEERELCEPESTPPKFFQIVWGMEIV